MGPKLADGIVQGQTCPDEFRTAPLWGLGQRIFFLHDGRTTDAVLGRFHGLSQAEQQDILNFLRSL